MQVRTQVTRRGKALFMDEVKSRTLSFTGQTHLLLHTLPVFAATFDLRSSQTSKGATMK